MRTKTVAEQLQQRSIRVDWDKGIIYDAWILGYKSKNRRDYPKKVLEARQGLYEGAQVYEDHDYERAKGKKPAARPMKELGGVTQAVYHASDGLRGNIICDKESPAGRRILNAAKLYPEKFGLSPLHTIVTTKRPDGWETVQDILAVTSVDVVTRPATTRGLFEAIQMDEQEVKETCEELLGKAMAAAAAEGNHDMAAKILKLMKKESGGGEAPAEGKEKETPSEAGVGKEEAIQSQEDPAVCSEVVGLMSAYSYQATEAQFDELVTLPTTRERIRKLHEFKKHRAQRPAAARLPQSQAAQAVGEAETPKPSLAPSLSKGATREQVIDYFNKR